MLGIRTAVDPFEKKTLSSVTIITVNSKRMKDLNVKGKTGKLLESHIENICMTSPGQAAELRGAGGGRAHLTPAPPTSWEAFRLSCCHQTGLLWGERVDT